jgi:peptide/nickel transport system substrate-binding protein
LKEAGYKGEEIVLLTNSNYDWMYKAAMVIDQEMKEIGFNTKLVVLDWPGSIAMRKDLSKWDFFFSGHSTRFDPSINNQHFIKESSCFKYDDPEMIKLINKGMSAVKFEDRKKAYEEVQRLLYKDVVWLQLYDLGAWEGWHTYVKGYEPWYMIHFWNTWLDK